MAALPAIQEALPEAVSAPSPILVAVPAAPAAMPVVTASTWRLLTRLLFRFCVAYFGTYVLFTLQAFIMLSFAATVTLVWSLADRRRRAYPGLHKWFHLFPRFGLGSTMMSYGLAKLIRDAWTKLSWIRSSCPQPHVERMP